MGYLPFLFLKVASFWKIRRKSSTNRQPNATQNIRFLLTKILLQKEVLLWVHRIVPLFLCYRSQAYRLHFALSFSFLFREEAFRIAFFLFCLHYSTRNFFCKQKYKKILFLFSIVFYYKMKNNFIREEYGIKEEILPSFCYTE